MHIHHVKKLAFRSASALAALPLLFSASAFSATPEPVDVTVTFVEAITITEVNALDFGLLDSTMANTETVAIDTADGTTDGGANIVGGTQEAAEVTITATAGVAVTLLVNNVTDGTHYTLASFVCNYNGAGESGCDGGGQANTSVASATVLIGATLTRNAVAMTAGVDNGSFDINMTYD
ncbi:DUF4402 domain-containing protein [Maricurvus nonylphenolicus]|uniref:DUF4402 domain-containing protein n=1 Tax=Maricurvus nonylphenolicus TaxID=1008307 RepID=UPI0036F2047A